MGEDYLFEVVFVRIFENGESKKNLIKHRFRVDA
jgi:hypothetical protein